MRFKSLTNDQTAPRYRYFNFYKPHKVDGKGFSSQMPTLKTVPSDQKSNRRTCAEECQMPFNGLSKDREKYNVVKVMLLTVTGYILSSEGLCHQCLSFSEAKMKVYTDGNLKLWPSFVFLRSLVFKLVIMIIGNL